MDHYAREHLARRVAYLHLNGAEINHMMNSNDNTKPTASELRRRFPSIPATATDDEVLARYDAHIKTSEPAPTVAAPPIERPSFESILKPTSAPASSSRVGAEPNTYGKSLGHEMADVAKSAGKMAVNIPVELAKDVASVPRLPIDLIRSLNVEGKLNDLPEVDYSSLRKLGLTHEQAKANVEAYIDELQKRAGDLQKKAAVGQEQSTRAAAAALSTATGVGTGALLGKAALKGVAGAVVKGAVEGAVAGGTYGGVSAAGQEKTLDEIVKDTAAASLVGLGLGGAFGLVGGKLKSRKEARLAVEAERKAQGQLAAKQAEEAAAQRAATEEAAAAQAAEQAAAAIPEPPRPIDLAREHQSQVGFVQMVKGVAKEHGMDSDDLLKLITKDEPSIQDLAAAHQRHGLTVDKLEVLRGAMPEVSTPQGVPSAAPMPGVEPGAPSLATPMQRQPIPQGAMLPRELAGAKPKWKGNPLQFENDLDRAAYIVAQAKKSPRDADYRKFLRAQGLTNAEIAARGRVVKQTIARAAEEAAPGEGIGVPSHESTAPQAGAPVTRVEGAPTPRTAREPGEFNPTSRVVQTSPAYQEVVRRIESSPEYRQTLDTSGGGRRISNPETWKKAVAQPMSVEELALWDPSARVGEVDVARAKILRQSVLDEHHNAMASADPAVIDEATRKLVITEAGFNNMTATPGRALQMQSAPLPGDLDAAAAFAKAYAEKVHELKATKVPIDQWPEQLEAIKRQYEVASAKESYLRKVANAADTWATAAKLTSPMTHIINTVSNGLTHVFTRGPEKFIASRILKAGGRTAEAEAVAKNALWAASQGAKDASRIAIEEAKLRWKGAAPKTLPQFVKEEVGKAELVAKPMPLKIDRVFRALDAADTYWKTIIYHSEVNQRALAQALSEKLEGAALAERTKWLMENAPDTWQKEAWERAKEYTFQEDPDKFLKALQHVQTLPGGRIFFAAFLKTPYNMIRFAARRSPLGLTALPFKNSRLRTEMAAGGVRRAEALARVSLGSAQSLAMIGLAYQGQFTGAYPKDERERARWEAEGIRPWSMKVGDRWITYSRTGTPGIQMMLAAGFVQALKEGREKDAAAFHVRLISQYARGPLELPMMQSTSALVDALEDPEHKLEKYIQTVGTGFVPNVLRDVRQQTDVTKRKPATIVEAIKDMIPGTSESVAPRVDVLGRVQKLEPNPLARATKLVGLSTETPETRLMDALQWAPTPPATRFSVPKNLQLKLDLPAQVELKGDQITAYKIDMGRAARAAIQRVMGFPGFADREPEVQTLLLQKAVSSHQAVVREKYKRISGVYGPIAQKGMSKWWDKRGQTLPADLAGKESPEVPSETGAFGLSTDDQMTAVQSLRKLYPAIPEDASDEEVLRRHHRMVAPTMSDTDYAARVRSTYLSAAIEDTQ